jgi:hypothetical protein
MSKPVSMKEAAQVVADANKVVRAGLPSGISGEVYAAVMAVVTREFLDNEYVNDLDGVS